MFPIGCPLARTTCVKKSSSGIMDAFDPLTPEIFVGNVTVVHSTVDSEALLPSDVAAPSEIPEKVWVCCRGFSEADWNACVCSTVQCCTLQ